MTPSMRPQLDMEGRLVSFHDLMNWQGDNNCAVVQEQAMKLMCDFS